MTRLESKPMLVLAGLIATCAAYVFFVMRPLHAKISELDRELQEKEVYIGQIGGETKELPAVKTTVADLRERVSRMRKNIAQPAEVSQVQEQITRAARLAEIRLSRFDPQATDDWKAISELPVLITAHGGFRQLADYIRRLDAMDQGLWITSLDMNVAAEKELRCDLSLSIFAENSTISD